MSGRLPLIVGIGGTTRPGSSSEKAMALALAAAERLGAKTRRFAGRELMLPMYDPGPDAITGHARELIEALRAADGVIIASPCYHGGVSGLIKNAIDYTEEMRADPRVYLDGRACGVIGIGYGNQGPGTVVQQLRQIVHALRGWNVPLGVAVNAAVVKFEGEGCTDPAIAAQIEIMAKQVVDFARMSLAAG
jgi:FMN reductase